MDVTCRKCGAAVPADHAFCGECGAVMAEAADEPGEDAPELAATVRGQYEKPTFAPQQRQQHAEGREAARAVSVTTPQRAGGRRSAALFAAGVIVILLLGGLLLYLVGLILSR